MPRTVKVIFSRKVVVVIVMLIAVIISCIMIFSATGAACWYYGRMTINPQFAEQLLYSAEGTSERIALKWFLNNHYDKKGVDSDGKARVLHPWLRTVPPSKCFAFRESDKVTYYWKVPNKKFPIAESLLDNKEVIEVVDMTMLRMLDIAIDDVPKGKRLFLVRALYIKNEVGYDIWNEDDKLLVDHTIFGNYRLPMKPAALVIALASIPKDVFVQCEVDF